MDAQKTVTVVSCAQCGKPVAVVQLEDSEAVWTRHVLVGKSLEGKDVCMSIFCDHDPVIEELDNA